MKFESGHLCLEEELWDDFSTIHLLIFSAVYGILRRLLPHQNSKASILFLFCFFTVQLLLPSNITEKKTLPA